MARPLATLAEDIKHVVCLIKCSAPTRQVAAGGQRLMGHRSNPRLPRWSRMEHEGVWLAVPFLLGVLVSLAALALRLLGIV